jgi:hypothetical protein
VAKHVLLNAVITVNGVDLSNRAKKISWNAGVTSHPAGAFGDAEDYSMPGVRQVKDITVEFYQDYAASNVYATLKPLWAANSIFTLTAKPDSAADSPTNPNFTVQAFVGDMPMLNGGRGEANMATVTFVPASPMTFDIA